MAISINRRGKTEMKVRDVLRVPAKDGWILRNKEGSHRQLVRPTKVDKVTVPGHPSIEVPPGTLSSILKQAGLKQ
jgi:predicted RNA binding protein YcfA (HicA-like mRNA interferase family)